MSDQYVEWTEELAVDNGLIDSDHRQLIILINRVYAAARGGADQEHIGAILCDLADYSSFHFNREERMMAMIAYNNKEAHIEQHNNFIESLSNLIAAFERGCSVSSEILDFVVTWFVLHIRVSDRDFGFHLRQFQRAC